VKLGGGEDLIVNEEGRLIGLPTIQRQASLQPNHCRQRGARAPGRVVTHKDFLIMLLPGDAETEFVGSVRFRQVPLDRLCQFCQFHRMGKYARAVLSRGRGHFGPCFRSLRTG
jgi:hypothetical protein